MTTRKNSDSRQVRDPHVMQAQRLLQLCASDPHCADFLVYSVPANAERIVDDFYAQGQMMVFDPPWLLRVSREILAALKQARAAS